MCGIAGIIRFDDAPIAPERARRMLEHLRPRGPDGEGVISFQRCTLAQTRLSIIDLLSGAQPMHVRDASGEPVLSLVFNGEIYNHRKLRRLLESRGHRFQSSHSDTEVLLYGYREWSEELPKHLQGMFAFAIWDHAERALFLCRDRTGEKPLYVRHRTDDGGRPVELSFASMVATLVHGAESNASLPVDGAALGHYLRLGYHATRSLLSGVHELAPAHWMQIDSDGLTRTQPYWRPPPVSQSSTSIGAKAGLRELLNEAIASRLEADVPIGCFLSGGVDSSIIAAIAQQTLRERGEGALKTFSVSMPAARYDESPHARRVAEHLGTNHTELPAFPSTDVIDDLQSLIAFSGEPTGDSSILPTYWVSRLTREHVKVALSGDGGDELFGGYDRYRAMRFLDQCGALLRATPERWRGAAEPKSWRAKIRRLAYAAHGEDPAQRYRRMIELFPEPQIESFAGPADPARMDSGTTDSLADWPDEPDPVHAAMRWDLIHYLPFDLLRKTDRASMAVALEVRCPMLDTQVCDLAGHLPTSVLMPGRRPKGLLRSIAADLLPAAIADRPKQGFAIPIGHWFKTTLTSTLRDYLFSGHLDKLGFNRRSVERLLHEHVEGHGDHTHRLFALLSLTIWLAWLENHLCTKVSLE